MDIEFHYYMTYLIAAKAGYSASESTTIAHAAQSVDDNHIPIRLVDEGGISYENSISQTMDILRPHEDSLIYPIFHFIPGDPKAPSARRKDGVQHQMVTTPNSALANQMLDAALRSKDLYRIGVSAHGFVDTWAHQNFVGARDPFNEFATSFWARVEQEMMAVGHAHAKHNPDWPALVWEDTRLVESTVDNRARFLEAAGCLLKKILGHTKPGLTLDQINQEVASLRVDLDADIGPGDNENVRSGIRIENFTKRGQQKEYGGQDIPPYVTGTWFAEAIQESRDGVLNNMKFHFKLPEVANLADLAAFATDVYSDGNRQKLTWRNPNPDQYTMTNWYRFQQAVKSHLSECTGMLHENGAPS